MNNEFFFYSCGIVKSFRGLVGLTNRLPLEANLWRKILDVIGRIEELHNSALIIQARINGNGNYTILFRTIEKVFVLM